MLNHIQISLEDTWSPNSLSPSQLESAISDSLKILSLKTSTENALPLEISVIFHYYTVGAAFVGATTLLWLNLSPFYISKENGQEKVLDALYHKLGPSMKLLNELIPRTRTSTDIDIRTRMLYSQRNGFLAGTVFPEEDHTPPVLNKNITHSYESKKIFL